MMPSQVLSFRVVTSAVMQIPSYLPFFKSRSMINEIGGGLNGQIHLSNRSQSILHPWWKGPILKCFKFSFKKHKVGVNGSDSLLCVNKGLSRDTSYWSGLFLIKSQMLNEMFDAFLIKLYINSTHCHIWSSSEVDLRTVVVFSIYAAFNVQ